MHFTSANSKRQIVLSEQLVCSNGQAYSSKHSIAEIKKTTTLCMNRNNCPSAIKHQLRLSDNDDQRSHSSHIAVSDYVVRLIEAIFV